MNRIVLVLLLVVSTGCTGSVAPGEQPPQPTRSGEQFEADRCGTLVGQVVWSGPVPRVPTIPAPDKPADYTDRSLLVPRRNPNLPEIDPATSGVREAVVFLRNVDPARSRPWDHPPVRVEIEKLHLSVSRGETTGRVGIVRTGSEVEFVSRETAPQLVRARGANFFTQPLSQRDVIRSRRPSQPGYIELSSGSGYFWMRGHLFVSEHPYYTCTEPTGRFTLGQVPEGDYEVVAWLPNWRERDHDLNADTGFRTATRFAEPLTRTLRVSVRSGTTTAITFPAFDAR